MQKYILAWIGFVGVSALFPIATHAQVETTDFNVQIVIDEECLINSASNLDFGATGVFDTALEGTSAIGVHCTNGTGYQIGLDEGNGLAATVAARKMTSGSSETVTYSLYTDDTHLDVWGNTDTVDTKADIGNGAVQLHTVYGLVPVPLTMPTPGTYNDTITVTVTY